MAALRKIRDSPRESLRSSVNLGGWVFRIHVLVTQGQGSPFFVKRRTRRLSPSLFALSGHCPKLLPGKNRLPVDAQHRERSE